MNELQIFKNEEFGQVRTILQDGSPWFAGKDVAEILGYSNPRDALIRHVFADDKGVVKLDTPGGSQELTVINESGLYALIFGSKLDDAQRFKRWVTSEVLPSIRKTGSYISPQAQNLQLLQGMLDQMKDQEARINAVTEQSQKAVETAQAIKEAIVEEYDDWRSDIKHKVSAIQKGSNQTYSETWNMLYSDLEKRAHCDLSTRVNNARFRLGETGASKTKIEAYSRVDVIESDPKLKEIFTTIIKEYSIKYVA